MIAEGPGGSPLDLRVSILRTILRTIRILVENSEIRMSVFVFYQNSRGLDAQAQDVLPAFRVEAAFGRQKSYEVDFLTVRGKRLVPIEVKSSGYRAHKSLDYLTEKYDLKLEEKIVLHAKDVARAGQVSYLPLYMAMCL